MTAQRSQLAAILIPVFIVLGIAASGAALHGFSGQALPFSFNTCGSSTTVGSNIALGCLVTIDSAPNYRLTGNDKRTLTNGKFTIPQGPNETKSPLWTQKEAVGWFGKTQVDIIIDLQKVHPIDGFGVHSAAGAADVRYPAKIDFYVRTSESDPWQLVSSNTEATGGVQQYNEKTISMRGLKSGGRYVKLSITADGSYIFTDEVQIFRGSATTVQIPNSAQGPCQSGATFKIGSCLNSLIEQNANGNPLQITIGSGSYTLSEAVLFFERSNISIAGSRDAENRNTTTITVDSALSPIRDIDVMQYFTFNIVNSSNISFSNLNLNGNYLELNKQLSGQRGITACATAGKTISNIAIRGVTMSDFHGFNALFGNTIEEKNWNIFMNKDAPLLIAQNKLSAGENRLYTFASNLLTTKDRLCSGAVSLVTFEGNTIIMRSVGFYIAPYSAELTSGIQLDTPRYDQPGPNDWRKVMDSVSSKFFGYVIRNNRFTVVSDLTNTGANALHSGIKMQNAMGAIVDNNIFDQTVPGVMNRRTFAQGAAINIASGMTNVLISKNTINFTTNLDYPAHGITVPAYFDVHPMYGIGMQKIFGGARNIFLLRNKLNNTSVRVYDCCSTGSGAGVFCTDSDSAAADSTQLPEVTLAGNTSDSGKKDADLIWLVSVKEKSRIDKNPSAFQCRTKVNIKILNTSFTR